MLAVKDIVRLKLANSRLEAHRGMPAPYYVTKPSLTGQFTALSDAILTELLGISPEVFRAQLGTARKSGAAYLSRAGQQTTGLSAVTSLIKGGSVLNKNMIVPLDFLRFDPKLKDHLVIGAFVRGQIEEGKLAYQDDIEIAGWATASDIQYLQASNPPPTFQSKLTTIMVPCSSLRPIETLFAHMNAAEISA